MSWDQPDWRNTEAEAEMILQDDIDALVNAMHEFSSSMEEWAADVREATLSLSNALKALDEEV